MICCAGEALIIGGGSSFPKSPKQPPPTPSAMKVCALRLEICPRHAELAGGHPPPLPPGRTHSLVPQRIFLPAAGSLRPGGKSSGLSLLLCFRLRPFTSYKLRLKATNDIGDSDFSAETDAVTTLQDGEPAGTPAGMHTPASSWSPRMGSQREAQLSSGARKGSPSAGRAAVASRRIHLVTQGSQLSSQPVAVKQTSRASKWNGGFFDWLPNLFAPLASQKLNNL